MTWKRLAIIVCLLFICGVVGGWIHSRHSVAVAPKVALFGSGLNMPPEIARMVRRSCADCHSEGTRWPWYAQLPPASWMIERDVQRARKAMNLSQWSRQSTRTSMGALAAACADVELGRMPDPKYLLMHPGARMKAGEVRQFCAWARSESVELRKEARLRAMRP